MKIGKKRIVKNVFLAAGLMLAMGSAAAQVAGAGAWRESYFSCTGTIFFNSPWGTTMGKECDVDFFKDYKATVYYGGEHVNAYILSCSFFLPKEGQRTLKGGSWVPSEPYAQFCLVTSVFSPEGFQNAVCIVWAEGNFLLDLDWDLSGVEEDQLRERYDRNPMVQKYVQMLEKEKKGKENE